MAKGIYLGDPSTGIAKKMKKLYIGDPSTGVARKVKKVYIGDPNTGLARLCWTGGAPFIGTAETPYLYKWEDAENPTAYTQLSQVSTSSTDKLKRILVRKSDGTILAEVLDNYKTYIYKSNINNLTWTKGTSYEHNIGNTPSEYLQHWLQELKVFNNRFYLLCYDYNWAQYSDDGLTWKSLGLPQGVSPSSDGLVRSMEYHKGNYFFAYNYGGIRYTSNANNWQTTTEIYNVCRSSQAVKSNGTYLFVAGAMGYGAVSRSLDGLTNWEQKLFDRNMYGIQKIALNGSNVIACFGGLIAYTKDNGSTWSYKLFNEMPDNAYSCESATCADGTFIAIYTSNYGSYPTRYMVTTKDFVTWKVTGMTGVVANMNSVRSLEGE